MTEQQFKRAILELIDDDFYSLNEIRNYALQFHFSNENGELLALLRSMVIEDYIGIFAAEGVMGPYLPVEGEASLSILADPNSWMPPNSLKSPILAVTTLSRGTREISK